MTRALALALASLALAGCPRRRDGALPYGATSADCGSCHEAHETELAGSAHGRATLSPVFAALLPRAEAAWGAEARERCESCHAPSHVPEAEPAIECVSCHAAVGNRGTSDGALVVDLGAPLDGPFDDAEPTPAHASRARGFVSDSTLCLTCHDVSGPGLFVERSVLEHELAVEVSGAPSCFSCHLPERAPGPIAAGAVLDRPGRVHSFVGPTPPADGSAVALADWALSLRDLFGHDRVPLSLRREGDDVVVALENAGVGHDLPTGVSFLRELRVDLELRHESGSTATLPAVLSLGDRSMRGETVVALPTDADRIEHHRLAPGEVAEARALLPAGTVSVVARLVLRPYRSEVVAALGVAPGGAEEVVVLESVLELP